MAAPSPPWPSKTASRTYPGVSGISTMMCLSCAADHNMKINKHIKIHTSISNLQPCIPVAAMWMPCWVTSVAVCLDVIGASSMFPCTHQLKNGKRSTIASHKTDGPLYNLILKRKAWCDIDIKYTTEIFVLLNCQVYSLISTSARWPLLVCGVLLLRCVCWCGKNLNCCCCL